MTRGCIKLKDPARFSDGFEMSNEKLQSAIKKATDKGRQLYTLNKMLHVVVIDGLCLEGHKVGAKHHGCSINGGGKGPDNGGGRFKQNFCAYRL